MASSTLLYLFAAGLGLRLSALAWQRTSHRWDSWFPLFRKTARAGLWTLIAVSVVAAAVLMLNALESPGLGLALAAWGLGFIVPNLYQFFAGGKPEDRTERGALIATAAQLRRLVGRAAGADCIELGGVRIPRKAEPYHLLINGSTGSGKSVAIKSLLTTLRARGDTVILVDSGGEFCSLFYDPSKDVVFNPFDGRCAPWSPMAEIEGPWDAESLARSIVPDGVGDNKEWNSYAQTFLSSTISALQRQGRNALADLLWAAQAASPKELAALLRDTPAYAQLASERALGSIRTIVGNYLSAYNHLESHDDAAFSVRQFVAKAKGSFLFLTYRDDQLDTLKHMLGCILDVASRAVLSLPADDNRRVWLIIDEFASIGKVQSVEMFATKARKAGGCLVVGLQSISQLKDRYGEFQAHSILSCLSSSLTLRCADADTAERMSVHLGEAEVVRASGGVSKSITTGVETASWSEQNTVRRLVMASELQALPNLEGYLKLAGSYPVARVKLKLPKAQPSVAPAFVERAHKQVPAPASQPTSVAKPDEVGARTTNQVAVGAYAVQDVFGPKTNGFASAPAVAERAREPDAEARPQPSEGTTPPPLSSNRVTVVRLVAVKHQAAVEPQAPTLEAASPAVEGPAVRGRDNQEGAKPRLRASETQAQATQAQTGREASSSATNNVTPQGAGRGSSAAPGRRGRPGRAR